MTSSIVIIDDDRALCSALAEDLIRRGYDVETCNEADSGFARITERDFDVVVTDVNMRGMNGIDLCARIVAHREDLPVIVITAFGSMETAVATLRAGAFDFLTKPFDVDHLAIAIESALRSRDLRREVKRLRRALEESNRFDELVGTSTAMQRVFDVVRRVAPSDATVLITGESGTGKELVAHALHTRSMRSKERFVTIDCASVPEGLFESELFGHVKGAFTDARTERRGMFAEADGGTLFLDEIGEMPLAMQAKLLRAIESRAVRPVGAAAEVSFDVRIVAATNRDLPTAVEERRFREDLFYRLNVVEIALPPLRARAGDVLLLAQAFLERLAARHAKEVIHFSPAAAERLSSYPWPGNVRELRNSIERAVALARLDAIVVEDLPAPIRDFKAASHVLVTADDPSDLAPLAQVERQYIERVLQAVGGNKRQAARILGLDRATLYRKLDRFGPRSE